MYFCQIFTLIKIIITANYRFLPVGNFVLTSCTRNYRRFKKQVSPCHKPKIRLAAETRKTPLESLRAARTYHLSSRPLRAFLVAFLPFSSEFPARSAIHTYTGAPSCVPRPGPALTPTCAPIPGTTRPMTARLSIRRTAPAAPCIGVAPPCALLPQGNARRACPQLSRPARGGGYLTLREWAEIPKKCPCLPVQPC